MRTATLKLPTHNETAKIINVNKTSESQQIPDEYGIPSPSPAPSPKKTFYNIHNIENIDQN